MPLFTRAISSSPLTEMATDPADIVPEHVVQTTTTPLGAKALNRWKPGVRLEEKLHGAVGLRCVRYFRVLNPRRQPPRF